MSAPFFSVRPTSSRTSSDGFLALGGGNLVTGAKEIEILGHFHVLVHAEEIRHVTDDVADGIRIAHHVVAQHEGLARGRSQERGKDAQRRGLACAIGTDEAKKVAALDGEVERV